ncbi:MFS transporter [Alkalimonas sp. NCh-2]|uniref:MFS transporter n=1 Tax=Alkalimonas sp. NCh-2 TaxID=3144846 RepID=UPI0031F674CC
MNATLPHAWRALTMATLAFAANFSVWTLYAVLAIDFQDKLDLTGTELGILLSAPILSGALLRFPLGILSEYQSARTLWLWQMALTIPALLLLPLIGSFQGFLWLGLWIGVSGVSFTFGIRYVTDWFSREQQGLALGIFGAGNAGAAISLILLPLLVYWQGWSWTGPAYAAGLLFMLLLFAGFAPRLPAYVQSYQPPWREQLKPLRHSQVWRFGLYYYFVFGSFLALILWLPQYYMQAYQLDLQQAMAFTLFFVTTSSMARALGGWFADRYGGRAVNWSVFWVCLVCLFFLSYPPTTMTIHGLERDVELTIEINLWLFTALIFVIGVAQGFGRASVLKITHDHYPQQMGSVGGIIATIGALGGCTLPIAFGAAQDALGIASASFMVLYAVLALCMTMMFFAIRSEQVQKQLQAALASNFFEDNDDANH